MKANVKTVNRAVDLPLKYPSDAEQREALQAAINLSLDAAPRIANAVIGAMYTADVEAQRGAAPCTYLKKANYPNTYKIAKDAAPPGMSSDVFNPVERWARNRYESKNSDGVPYRVAGIRGSGSVPSVRRCPYPVTARSTWASKSHRPHLGRGGELFVWLPLMTESGCQWMEVELVHKAKRGYRRQYEAIKRMMDGEMKPGEIAVYRKSGGRVFVKFVGKLPVRDTSLDAARSLVVRTRVDALLVASARGRPRDWWMNKTHIPRRIMQHQANSERLRQDQKAEMRTRRGRGPVQVLSAQCANHQRWMDSELQRITRSLVNFAVRQRCGRIVWDDSEKGYINSFPWAALQTMVQWKAAEHGIAMLSSEDEYKRLQKIKDEIGFAELGTYLQAMADQNTMEEAHEE